MPLSALAVPPDLTQVDQFAQAGGKRIEAGGMKYYVATIPKAYWQKINRARELQGRNVASMDAANNAPIFNKEYLRDMLHMMAMEFKAETGLDPTREQLFLFWQMGKTKFKDIQLEPSKVTDEKLLLKLELFRALEKVDKHAFIPPPVHGNRERVLPPRFGQAVEGQR